MKYSKNIKKSLIGNVTETRITVTKSGKNKNIESDEVKGLFKEIEKKTLIDNTHDYKLMVRVQNPINDTWTLKSFQAQELNFEDYDEYFAGKVKDSSKFAKFDKITFIIHTTLKEDIKDQIHF